jgi:selenide,water dikinase
MDPAVLAQVLRPLHNLFSAETHPELLVGLDVADDAAVYQLNDEQAIISTLDFFTPVVDDPYDYGAIAAANAMSDVYAMGGEVLFALNIGAFPPDMDPALVTEILRGGAEKVIEAGGVIAGGHTVQDKEPKYGLAVTGLVHPARFFTKEGARPGDRLILTKPLGTGAISTALKRGSVHPDRVAAMVASMKRLNRCAARAGQAAGVQAATDVTGFGLLGHASEMTQPRGLEGTEAGRVGFRFWMSAIPLLPGATHYAAEWIFPGGSHNNKAFYSPWVRFEPGIPEERQMLLWDAQTSGGLLLAVPAGRVDAFFAECQAHEQPAWVIGEVVEGEGIEVVASPGS